MLHATFIVAAGQALDTSADAVGATGAAVAVVVMLLGVVAMFGLLFWTKWGPTDTVDQERRRRLNQNPAYSG